LAGAGLWFHAGQVEYYKVSQAQRTEGNELYPPPDGEAKLLGGKPDNRGQNQVYGDFEFYILKESFVLLHPNSPSAVLFEVWPKPQPSLLLSWDI
jgi:hypothetical protein